MFERWCGTAWRQGGNYQVMDLDPYKGAGDWRLLKIPISDDFDKVPELGPFISIEVMLVWTALMKKSLDVKLHTSLLVVSALGAMRMMNGEIPVFLAGLEFESSFLVQVLDRH
jgi:hypothetical protein